MQRKVQDLGKFCSFVKLKLKFKVRSIFTKHFLYTIIMILYSNLLEELADYS